MKSYKILMAVFGVALLFSAYEVRAEEVKTSATAVNAEKPPVRAWAQNASSTKPGLGTGLRDEMRNARNENLKEKMQIKDQKIDQVKGLISGKRDETSKIRDYLQEKLKNASTTAERQKLRKEAETKIREIKKTEKKDELLVRKEALLKQFEVAINTIESLKAKVAEKISTMEQAGTDMTISKNLLSIADTKLQSAKDAVKVVVDWTPATGATSTTEISLTKPRELSDKAIKSIKDAREALTAVIKSLNKK